MYTLPPLSVWVLGTRCVLKITHSTVYRTRAILRLHSRTVTQLYGYAVT
nr:MAG TPA: hypothetical protein [Caudoviricetes sp.]